MSETVIVTDSTSYIDEEARKKYNIVMIPLTVIFGSESYREEIDITPLEFYEKMRGIEQLPTTSQPPVGEFVQLYEELGETYEDIIVITLSSEISGTYQAARTAADMVEHVNVHVFDSEISSAPQAYYVLEAAKMAEADESAEKIMERLNEMKENGFAAFFMVEDLTNLRLGGRLTGAQAFFGSLLQIKPVLKFADKIIQPYEKIRTRRRAITRLIELFDEDATKANGKQIHASVLHANCLEDAHSIKEQLEQKHENAVIDIGYFGPVLGTHLGEKAVGLTWYKP